MNPNVRRVLGESLEAKPVEVKTRPEEYQVCPHCQKEIYEKSTYSEDGGVTFRHSCGGVLEFPEPDLNSIPDWLRPGVEQAVAARKAGKSLL